MLSTLRSVRGRLLALVVLSIVPVIGVVMYETWRATDERIAEAYLSLQGAAESVVAMVDADVRGAELFLQSLAELPGVLKADAAACEARIGAIIRPYKRYSSVFVARPDGTPVCATIPMPRGVNFSDREYFSRALAAKAPILGAPVVSRARGTGVLPVAFAARNNSGQVSAVLVAALDLAWYQQFESERNLYPGFALTWWDGEGKIAYRYPDPEKWIGASLADTALGHAARKTAAAGTAKELGVDGIERVHGFARLARQGAVDLNIGLSVPVDELAAAPHALHLRTTVLIALVSIVALAAAWLLGEISIRRPLVRLATVAARIGQGDLAARAGGPYSADEVGILARRFDAMAADVQVQHEMLRRSQERVRLHFQQTALAVIEWDAGLRVVEWNPAAERIFGYSKEEALGRHAAFIVPDEVRGRVKEMWQTLVERRGGFRSTSRNLHKDGRAILCEWHNTPLVDGEGRFIGAASLALDVTERQRAEDEIRRLNAELEQRVQERTRQLEDANRELESFSYSVSHDLRAPLRHVQGYVELLVAEEGEKLSAEARSHLRVIEEASVEMGQLIDDLLMFSRMGRVEMHQTRADPNVLAQEVIRSLEIATGQRNIEWKIGPLPAVVADPSMLRQVFANLVGNAVKYTRPRDPARIEIGCAGEEGGQLVFFVRDNGVGFDMKYAHKLFTVFQRLHRADEFEGTGIGLANVRRVISRHGGRVWAEGRVDGGAAFFFTLKAAPRDNRV